MPKEIIVDFDKDGNPSLDVKGAKGKECLALTQDIEEALGAVVSREEKPEMKQRNEQQRISLRN